MDIRPYLSQYNWKYALGLGVGVSLAIPLSRLVQWDQIAQIFATRVTKFPFFQSPARAMGLQVVLALSQMIPIIPGMTSLAAQQWGLSDRAKKVIDFVGGMLFSGFLIATVPVFRYIIIPPAAPPLPPPPLTVGIDLAERAVRQIDAAPAA